MPAYSCSAYCKRQSESALYARTFYARSLEEALGKILLLAKKEYSSQDGWSHHVAAISIPTDWLEEVVTYEKRNGAERDAAEKALPTSNEKEGVGDRQGTV